MSKLSASLQYRQASSELRARFSNGCGPSWFPAVFRSALSRIFGNSVCEACSIHDWDYNHNTDRAVADRRFKNNLLFLAKESAKDSRMLFARSAVAYVYYVAVRIFGIFSYRG